MTLSNPEEDLAWVTFGEDTDSKCQMRNCTSQATHKGVYTITAGSCEHVPTFYCLLHKEEILQRGQRSGGKFRCRQDEARLQLVRMERA